MFEAWRAYQTCLGLLLLLAAACRNSLPTAGPPRDARTAARVAVLRAKLGTPCELPEGIYILDGGRFRSVEECDHSRELEIADLECKEGIGHADDDLDGHTHWWAYERHRYDACMDGRFPGIVQKRRNAQHAMLPDVPDALYDASYETERGTYLLEAFSRDCANLDAGAEKRNCTQRILASIAETSCLARSRRDGGEWSAEQMESCKETLLYSIVD